MNENEIQEFFATLGIEAASDSEIKSVVVSVANQVTKCIKAVKNGKNDGSIALPVKLEGNYKNGKEIEKEIVDAYAAFYDQVDKIARKRVSSGSVKGKNKSKYFTIEEYKQELDTLEKLAIKFKNVSKSKTGNETIKTARNNVNSVLTEMRYTARTSARDKINEIKDKSLTRLDKTKTRYAKQVSRAQYQQQSKETEVKQLQQQQKDLNDAKSKLEQIQNDPKSVDMSKKQIRQITKETVEVYGSLEEAINTLNNDYDHITTSLEIAQQELRSISSHRNDLLKEATTVFENINKELTRLGANISGAGVVLEEEVRKINQNYENKIQDKKTIEGYAIGGGRASQATPGADTHLGTRSANSFAGYLYDEDRLRATSISPYANTNSYMRQVYKSLQEEQDNMRNSLVQYTVDPDTIEPKGNAKPLPSEDYSKGFAKTLSNELAKQQGGVIHGHEDSSVEKMKATAIAMRGLLQKLYGEYLGDIKYIDEVVFSLFNRFSKSEGQFEITDGEYEKGESRNYSEAREFQKEELANIQELLQKNEYFEPLANSLLAGKVARDHNDPKAAEQASEEALHYWKQLNGIKDDVRNITKTVSGDTKRGSILSKFIAEANKTYQEKENNKKVEQDKTADKKSNAVVAAIESQKEQDVSLAATTHQQASTQNKTSKEISQITETNANDGFDAERNASKLINTNEAILDETKKNNSSTKTETNETPKKKRGRPRKTKTEKPETSVVQTEPPVTEPPIIIETPEIPQTSFMEKSNITASAFNLSIWTNLKNAFDDLTGVTKKYKDILSATADEQDDLAAERIIAYGLNNGRNPTDTGDKANIRRALELFRTNKQSIVDNPELLQEIKMTKGVTLDTTEVTKQLNKILTGKQMRNAQMGGSPLRQILGSLTGFVGMPSIEKSRAQAEGMNQIMGNITDALQDVVIAIQTKETELSGLEKKGDIKIGEDGAILEGTSAAKKTAVDLAEHKLVLETILADMTTFDKIIKKSGGDYGRILKQFTFSSPVLRENNKLIRNMRAGLDKNGKAMKFQSRTAEMMNYAFQLMSRHIAQIGKNLLMAMNPITLIKKAFNLFSSYDPKWQRTMNVVVYNLREVIRPIIEWLAQKLVNIIGFFDIISQTIQSYLGNKPISLFDQENAKKTKELYEDMYDTAASFDELHDIGSSTSENNPDNLLGEIYKPTVSEEWKKLAKDIGELFGGIIKGDLGFSEVMAKIIQIGADGVELLWTDYIKPFITDTIWPAIKDNWLEILAWIAGAFAGWTFLKWAGGKLVEALFGGLTGTTILTKIGSALKTVAGKLGGVVTKVLGSKLSTVLGTTIAAALSIAAGEKLGDFFNGKIADITEYNTTLMQAGGNKKDKKSDTLSTIGSIGSHTLGYMGAGTAIGTAIAGGNPIGAVIGGIIGGIAGAVKGAYEVIKTVSDAAKVSLDDMNKSLQSTAFYEGAYKGYSTEVQNLQTLIDILNQTYDTNKQKLIEQGVELGISKEQMISLTDAVDNGTFSFEMLTGNAGLLKDEFGNLMGMQEKVAAKTEKLEQAKLKLAKVENDLAILQDLEAGNYEIAAARIELAFASEMYSAEEASTKMTQVLTQAGDKAGEIAEGMSDDMKDAWLNNAAATDEGVKKLKELYLSLDEEARKTFKKDYGIEAGSAMEKTLDAMQDVINDTTWDWSHPFKSLMSKFTGDWSWKLETTDVKSTETTHSGGSRKVETTVETEIDLKKVPHAATGTNYVASDGLAYIHAGEAIIPKKYNPAIGQQSLSSEEISYMNQMMNTMRSLDNTMKQGITVNGQFTQRGSDLVAVVNKTRAQAGAELISNPAYAR